MAPKFYPEKDTVLVPYGCKSVQGFDIYIGGTWHGSRSTVGECMRYVNWASTRS